MEVCRRSSWLLLLLGVSLLAATLQGVQGEAESEGPSESECRPYIEKALKELETGEASDTGTPATEDSKEDVPTVEVTIDEFDHQEGEGEDEIHEEGHESTESVESDQNIPSDHAETEETEEETSDEGTRLEKDVEEMETTTDDLGESQEAEAAASEESEKSEESKEAEGRDDEGTTGEIEEQLPKTESAEKEESGETVEGKESQEVQRDSTEDTQEKSVEMQPEEEEPESNQETEEIKEATEDAGSQQAESVESDKFESVEEQAESVESEQVENDEGRQEENAETEQIESDEARQGESAGSEQTESDEGEKRESAETEATESDEARQGESAGSEQTERDEGEKRESAETEATESLESQEEQEKPKESEETKEDDKSESQVDIKSDEREDDKSETKEDIDQEEPDRSVKESEAVGESDQKSTEQDDNTSDTTGEEEHQKAEEVDQVESETNAVKSEEESTEDEIKTSESEDGGDTEQRSDETSESAPEEELGLDIEIPTELRQRVHVEHLLKLDAEASENEKIINRISEITLRELKKLYENAIKPLEVLYKYRDLSNRHFGDAEIFSKPLILFMGPWSGGKSSIINYLLDNEYNETSLRTGAEPSPAYFNILMYGEEPEILDGTQLAADFTFSGLQKFGQGLEERLRGVKLPSKLLEKVNIVEIPGILEVRKQVSRVFPFNDACQWFIDRADIIFLVYDPSKLDVGPETEAILDQLKGREHQTRIILNKADQVKPEELMRVQGALIWNISPLMSSAQPPIMYTTSLWSRPYESWAPVRLLHAQERAFLRDLRSAVDKRIENKIASARRFAVRVRNHAKMVDCYLTTYYNHKSVFGNRKQVADEIIEHPQDYHIYEGLSTLTNISRYDLPDPDVYRDFFKLNPLYDFQQLSATCTYFRGCPINRLDVAIAYDLPELVGKHKRLVESALAEANQTPVPGS